MQNRATRDHARRPAARPLTTQKLGLSVAATLAAVNVLGLGAYATWTDTDTDQVTIEAGTLGISLGADGADNRLYVDAKNIAPGDRIQRAVTLVNDGSVDLGGVVLSTSSANGSQLFTGADRLDLNVVKCSVPFTETVHAVGTGDQTGEAYSYSCGATTTYITGSPTNFGDVQHNATPLGGLDAMSAGGVDYLMVDMQLPASADNSYQGITETITLTIDAVQRDGEFR